MERRPIQAGIDLFGLPDDASGEEARIKDAFACWTAGVTVVAVRQGSGVRALTISAFVPLSLRPPLLLICIHTDAPLLSDIEDVRRFTVNILAVEQRGHATRFADRFTVDAGVFLPHGDPTIADALASFVCTLEDVRLAGDHCIVIGAIEDVRDSGRAVSPLVYFGRNYREIVS